MQLMLSIKLYRVDALNTKRVAILVKAAQLKSFENLFHEINCFNNI